jgi:outer membrane protein OmpA-like peptidoglycan-associated protein
MPFSSSRPGGSGIPLLLVFAVACGAAGGRHASTEPDFVLKIGGKSKFDPVAPRAASAAAPPAAPAAQHGALPAPVGAPPHALGFSQAVDGCLRGYAYQEAPDSKALPDDYADAAPGPELWGCEWALDGKTLPEALPGAAAAQAFAVRYQGTFRVAASGVFHFGTRSSSALRFSVDGALVSENGAGGAGIAASQQSGVFLGAGKHQVLIEYLAAGSSLSLDISVTAPGASGPTPFSLRPSSPFYAAQGLDYTGSAGGTGQAWRSMVDVSSEAIELKGKIFFQSGSAELNREDQSEASLLAVAKTLSEHPNVRCVEIQGHTDARGDAELNTKLSRARAQTVRGWLVQAGVEPHRLTTHGFGGSQARETNATDAGRAANRRVEFLIHAPNADGSCPRGDTRARAEPVVRVRADAPEAVEQACKKSDEVRSALAGELGSWVTSHRSCATDAECTQAVPLQCEGKSKALRCAWELVNQSSVEDLQVYGARLDSVKNHCAALPEDHLVRSCGGCEAKALRCDAGRCKFAP